MDHIGTSVLKERGKKAAKDERCQALGRAGYYEDRKRV